MSVVCNGTSYHGSTLTTLIRNFNAGKCKLKFDQHNGTKDNNGNKRYKEAVILDENTSSATSLLL